MQNVTQLRFKPLNIVTTSWGQEAERGNIKKVSECDTTRSLVPKSNVSSRGQTNHQSYFWDPAFTLACYIPLGTGWRGFSWSKTYYTIHLLGGRSRGSKPRGLWSTCTTARAQLPKHVDLAGLLHRAKFSRTNANGPAIPDIVPDA